MISPRHTIDRILEERDFLAPLGHVRFGLSGRGEAFELDLTILRCQRVTHAATNRYIHLAPPFCRLFLFSGKGGSILMDGKRIRCVPGRLYLLAEGHPFEATYFAASELIYAHVLAGDPILGPAFAGGEGLRMVDHPEAAALLKRACGQGDPLEIQCAVAAAISLFAARDRGRLKDRDRLSRQFRPLFEAVRQTPPAQLRVKGLAKAMGMSAPALSRSFRRQSGTTVKSYLANLYRKRAGELLLYSRLPLQEVAKQLGHRDVHYFHHEFRRLTGRTPQAYRQAHQGRPEP
ncbi:MAG: AraC family transcriptional regulator [Lentisphaeria bacterium]